MKKVSILLVLCLTLSLLLSSCSNQNGASSNDSISTDSQKNEDKSATTDETPVITLTVAVNENTVLDESNYAINYIQEHANVKLDFNLLPTTDTDAKLNLMLASNDYSDIIVNEMSRSKMIQLGMQDKILMPINDLIDKYSVNLKEIFNQRPQYEKLSYASDGNIYGFIVSSEAYHVQAYPKLWVNQNWMKKLGIEDPQTTEDLYNMLVAFRDNDPNGNGLKDEIPLTGSIDWDCPAEYYLLNSFLPFDSDSLAYAKNGKVIFAGDTNELREGIRYIKTLVDENLLDIANFTQTSDQMQQIIRQEPFRVGAYTADHYAMGINLENTEMNKAIVALPPVEGPNGARYQPKTDFIDQGGNFSWFITDKCKDPVAAFKLGDFMLGVEPTLVKQYGVEGDGWGKLDTPVKSVLGLESKYWVNSNYNSDTDFYANTFWTQPLNNLFETRELFNPVPEDLYSTSSYEARLTLETQKVVPYFYDEYLPKKIEMYIEDPNEVTTFSEIRTNLLTFVKSSITQFITGEMDIEKDWDSYVNQLQQYQLDEYLKTYQKYYDMYNNAGK